MEKATVDRTDWEENIFYGTIIYSISILKSEEELGQEANGSRLIEPHPTFCRCIKMLSKKDPTIGKNCGCSFQLDNTKNFQILLEI
jgi:hypothetical protein